MTKSPELFDDLSDAQTEARERGEAGIATVLLYRKGRWAVHPLVTVTDMEAGWRVMEVFHRAACGQMSCPHAYRPRVPATIHKGERCVRAS